VTEKKKNDGTKLVLDTLKVICIRRSNAITCNRGIFHRGLD